jgi:hypothetical protein
VVKFDVSPLENTKITSLITSLVQLLDKAAIDLSKNSQEYFKLLYVYANMVKPLAFIFLFLVNRYGYEIAFSLNFNPTTHFDGRLRPFLFLKLLNLGWYECKYVHS